MSRVIWSHNETPGFRHFFHYHAFLNEAFRLLPEEDRTLLPYYYEVEVLAFDQKEWRIYGLPDMARNDFPAMPSGN
jgi:hypothetical protein